MLGMTIEELEAELPSAVFSRLHFGAPMFKTSKNEDLLGGLKNEKAWQNYCTAQGYAQRHGYSSP
jgi:hypothetical protein